MRCAFTVVALIMMAPPSLVLSAEARFRISVADFSFKDTSGEVRDQAAEHNKRLSSFQTTLAHELAEADVVRAEHISCDQEDCSASAVGIPILSRYAVDQGSTHLLIGEIKKMSTLIGQIKYALLDLKTNKALCDRYLTYRGDTDEAWHRAAIYAARDAKKYCFNS